MLRKNFPRRKDARREAAEAMRLEARKRSPQERRLRLDHKPGIGVGAKRERRRIEIHRTTLEQILKEREGK